MKIALVNNSKVWGGAEEMCLSLAIGLRDRNHNVELFLREGSETVDKFINANFCVFSVPLKGTGIFKDIIKIIRRAQNSRFDLIHVHRNHDLTIGKIMAAFTGSPLLLTQHCLSAASSRKTWNLANRIVTVSQFIADDLLMRFPNLQHKLKVIHNGINLENFASADRTYWTSRPELEGKWPILGVVGQFYKNQEELVDIFARVREQFPAVALLVIGQDDARKPLIKKKAADLGVSDAVYFVGEVPHEEMKHALAGLDLNVSAFRREGFGLSVVEGMAVGTPFVGYRAGGYKEIVVNGETGCLVETSDELIDVVIKLLVDTEAMELLQANGRSSVQQKFSFNTMLMHYESIYSELSKNNISK